MTTRLIGFGVLTSALLWVCIAGLLYLSWQQQALLLFLIFCTQINDVTQYVCGKVFGKHALCPKISPNKTLEGALYGGVVTVLVATPVWIWLTSESAWLGLVVSGLLCVTGILGDLYISALKRQLQLKDTGRWIQGHGGIFDRLDSLLLSSPVFMVVLFWLK